MARMGAANRQRTGARAALACIVETVPQPGLLDVGTGVGCNHGRWRIFVFLLSSNDPQTASAKGQAAEDDLVRLARRGFDYLRVGTEVIAAGSPITCLGINHMERSPSRSARAWGPRAPSRA